MRVYWPYDSEPSFTFSKSSTEWNNIECNTADKMVEMGKKNIIDVERGGRWKWGGIGWNREWRCMGREWNSEKCPKCEWGGLGFKRSGKGADRENEEALVGRENEDESEENETAKVGRKMMRMSMISL